MRELLTRSLKCFKRVKNYLIEDVFRELVDAAEEDKPQEKHKKHLFREDKATGKRLKKIVMCQGFINVIIVISFISILVI